MSLCPYICPTPAFHTALFFFFALFSFSPSGADPPGEDGGHLTHSIQTTPAALQEGAEA